MKKERLKLPASKPQGIFDLYRSAVYPHRSLLDSRIIELLFNPNPSYRPLWGFSRDPRSVRA
jgi:hypothetical protein